MTEDAGEGVAHRLEMTFSWGELYNCYYTESWYEPGVARIIVKFYINDGE